MQDRHKDYLNFKKQYPNFIYNSYKYEMKENSIFIEYNFEIENLKKFNPTWTIDIKNKNEKIDLTKLEQLVFSLGMVELVSYWKITCSPNISIPCMHLNEEQINWWQKLYKKGLGEFLYLNNIKAESDFMNITSGNKTLPLNKLEKISEKNVLIPIGGGKDSIVTLELLKDNFNTYPYIINQRGATTNTVKKAFLEDKLINAKRTLDQNMIELNKQGFLNGHTPFSALVAFSSVIAAYLNNLGYVCLSNEASANESTVKNSDVNHQYSKSFEFELDFNEYHENNINTPVKYFSFLRPLSEMQIAKAVAQFPQYHDIFRSCNKGSKEDIWCGDCPKCLFVYIMLAPYLSTEEMKKIFGANLLDEEKLMLDFQKLTGILDEKPFECVGERDEVKSSLNLTLQKYKQENKELPLMLKYFADNFKNEKFKNFDNFYNEENLLPPKFVEILKGSVFIYDK